MSVFNCIIPAYIIAYATGDYKHFEMGMYSMK